MIRLNTLALLAGLAVLPALSIAPALAETAKAPATTSATKTDAGKTDAAKPDADKADDAKTEGGSKMSEADKRAKAIDCSKQADAKKLHGEERKKFRSSCKRGK